MNRLQHPHGEQVGDHRGASDGDERQRNTRHGRDAHCHADVDEHLEEETEDDSPGDDRTVEIAGNRDHPEAAPDDEEVEQQEDRAADEAPLLGEGREHEVRRVLGQVIEPRLARPLDSSAGEATGSDRSARLGDVVGEPARVAVRVREPGQPRRLVRLQHLDARGGQGPEDARDEHHRRDAENHEVEPADTGEEQHGREGGPVHERRAEIRLEEDERYGPEPEPDRGEHRPDSRHPAAALDEEPRDREHEERLAEFGRLELEGAEVDPPLRAAHGLGEDEDEEHDADRRPVDEAPVALVERRRDQRTTTMPATPRATADRLAVDVVVGAPRHVEAGDPGDRPEPVGDEGAGREEQQPVQPAHDGADAGGDEGRRAEGRRTGSGIDDQSTFTSDCVPAL